ncbi:MAG: hypothetical protein WDN48_14360 [Pseudolabrys sp.]
MTRILRKKAGRGAFPAVLHCFTGGRDLAFAAVELGHYVVRSRHSDVQELAEFA